VAEVRLPHGPGPFRGPAPFAYARTLPRMPVTIPHAYASSPIRGNGVPPYGDGRSVRGCHADVMPTATSPLADRSPGSAGRHASPADQRYPLRDHLAPRPDESQREQADRFGHHCQSQNGDRPGQASRSPTAGGRCCSSPATCRCCSGVRCFWSSPGRITGAGAWTTFRRTADADEALSGLAAPLGVSAPLRLSRGSALQRQDAGRPARAAAATSRPLR
jgi:hypothetical protein